MKLLELYTSKNGDHKFICVEGLRRTDLDFRSNSMNVMLGEAVSIIEGDPAFEHRIRVYDAHGINRGNVAMWITLERLKSWARRDREPLPA